MQEFVREFACRILLDIPHAAGVRRIQSLRAFRRPKLGGLELPGFQDWFTLTRTAAEHVISESLGSLRECCPHQEILERHLGAARGFSEISWCYLQQLLVIFGRSFTESWGSLGDFKASPACLLGSIGCLGGINFQDLDA